MHCAQPVRLLATILSTNWPVGRLLIIQSCASNPVEQNIVLQYGMKIQQTIDHLPCEQSDSETNIERFVISVLTSDQLIAC